MGAASASCAPSRDREVMMAAAMRRGSSGNSRFYRGLSSRRGDQRPIPIGKTAIEPVK